MAKKPQDDERLDLPSVSLTELRDALPDVINRVQYAHERLVIRRHNKAVAAVVSIADVRQLEGLEDLIDLQAALEALDEVKQGGELIDAEDALKELGL